MTVEKEKLLVTQFRDAKKKRDDAKLVASEAQAEMNELEAKLLELMQAEDKKRTATYEGIGFITAATPAVRASLSAGNQVEGVKYLKEIGRVDLIKLNVNAKSLSKMVREMLEKGEEPPKCITYYLQPSVGFYAR